MATIQTNLTCELQNGSVAVQYLNGVLFTQDVQGNQINVAVYDGGEPATISGTVSGNVIRSDGGTVAVTGGSISGNVASITLPAAAYAVPGVASIIVKLSTSGVVTTLAAVVANIYESSTSTAIDPGTIIPSVTALVAQIDTAVASIPADYSTLWTTLAPAFSTSTTYAAGQYVTYNGGLYRFTAAHTGNWSASDVVAANIGNDLSDLKNAIGEEITAGYITQDISRNTAGVSIAEDDGDLIIYGTASSVRRICCLNGQDATMTTSTAFSKTLDAGTYHIVADLTGSQTDFRVDGTYSTFASGNPFVICSNSEKDVVVTFTAPVMVGFYLQTDKNYGTSGSPSVFSISIKRITAKDIVSREHNDVHSPGYQNAFVGVLNNFPTFVFNADKSITVSIPKNAHARAFWTVGYSVANTSTTDRTFIVPANYCFVYDTVDKDFDVKAYNAYLSTDIVCFWNTSSGKMDGPWLSFLALQNAENAKNENLDFIPDYYDESDYLEDKISDIQTIGSSLNIQSARFVFITDYHVKTNTGISPTLAKKIMQDTGIKELFFNGDFNNKEQTAIGGYKVLCDFLEVTKPLEFGNHIHYTTGNHEYNDPSATESSIRLTRPPLFQLFNAYDAEIVSLDPDETNSYYVDYPSAKIRVYGIDCDYDSAITPITRKCVFDSLLTVPEGYAVIITSHIGKTSSSEETLSAKFEMIMECCAAMNDGTSATFNLGSPIGTVTYDFAGRARTFVGALTGHTHMDGYLIYDNRFPVIITECDTLDSTRHPERTAGTITEQAFEVVQIDVEAKRIYLTRIGNGDDRTFSFGTGAGLIT